jgi:proteasome alpha subunit
VLFDGSVTDEHGFVGMGGSSEELTDHLREGYQPDWDLASGVRAAAGALAGGGSRRIPAEDIEAAVLERGSQRRRKFRRLSDDEVAAILADGQQVTEPIEPGEDASPNGSDPDASSNGSDPDAG